MRGGAWIARFAWLCACVACGDEKAKTNGEQPASGVPGGGSGGEAALPAPSTTQPMSPAGGAPAASASRCHPAASGTGGSAASGRGGSAVVGGGGSSAVADAGMAPDGGENEGMPGPCTRAALKAQVDAYFAALAKHDPSGLPLADDVKVTENGKA